LRASILCQVRHRVPNSAIISQLWTSDPRRRVHMEDDGHFVAATDCSSYRALYRRIWICAFLPFFPHKIEGPWPAKGIKHVLGIPGRADEFSIRLLLLIRGALWQMFCVEGAWKRFWDGLAYCPFAVQFDPKADIFRGKDWNRQIHWQQENTVNMRGSH